jgi:hypothetical protein
MHGIEPDEIYEHAVEDFRTYTGSEQELPTFQVVEGSVLEGEPEFFSETEVYHGQEEDLGSDRIEELVYEHHDSRDTLRVQELEDQGRKVIEHYGELRDDDPVVDLYSMGLPHGYEDMVDRNNYRVVLGEEDLQNFNVDTVQNLMLGGIKLHAEAALEEAFQPVQERILEQYSSQDPEIEIEDFYWEGLGDGGGYGFGNGRFSLSVGRIDEVDIQTGEIKSNGLESMLYHEGIHAMQANTNPMFNEYIDGLRHRSRMTDGVDEVMGHPRSFVEATTTFETAREYGDFEDERERMTGVREAWEEGPEALREYAENNTEKLLDNEYVFGQWVASVVNHYMRKTSDQPLEDTREWLIRGVTPVNGMAGTAKKAFENIGVEPPEALDEIRSFDERVPEEERKNPDRLNDFPQI